MRRGFTLIEAMIAMAVIGLLSVMVIYVTTQAQRQARDGKRKSDLAVISLAFQARYEAKTCSGSGAVGFYPGTGFSDANSSWRDVSTLQGTQDGCGAFSEYLVTMPKDPNSSNPYRFNLSSEGGLVGKHFRLSAVLEKKLTSQERDELDRMKRVWTGTFRGAQLPASYNYLIGR